jgi:hypothetical protein
MTLVLSTTALYTAVGDRLSGANAVFDDRIYSRYAPPGTTEPYVVMMVVGGGDANRRRHRDAELVLQVVCWSKDISESEAGAASIDEVLDDSGIQDTTTASHQLNASANNWLITAVTGGRIIDQIDNNEQRVLYGTGKTYTVKMETQ